MMTKRALGLILVVLVLAAPVPRAIAGEFSAVLNGKSFHLGASEDWNEENYGLGVEYEFSTKSRWKPKLMANGFRDSNEQMSYMAGGGLHRTLYSTERFKGLYIDAGIDAFLMTRKEINDNRPFPGILPSLTIGNDYLGMNVTYLPKKAVEEIYDNRMTDPAMSGIVFLQFKVAMSARSRTD